MTGLTKHELTRFILDVALGFYCAGLFALALFPTSDIRLIEWVVMASAAIAGVGLAAHSLPQITLPGERYARVVVGFAGLTTLFAYLIFSSDQEYEQTRLGLLIFSGIVASWGSFLVEEDDSG